LSNKTRKTITQNGNKLKSVKQDARHVLIAGGAGFLGSHLVRRMLDEGHQVTCLDNFLTGRPENVTSLGDHPRFRLIEHDIVEPICAEETFHEIYNLACPASPPQYQKDPVHTLLTNVVGSLNLLNLARDHNARVFLASTSEVYGDPTVHPQPEEYRGNVNTTGPRACYDEGKRCAETLYFDFARLYGLNIKVARIFNTYGPNMQADDGRAVSNFIVQALGGQDITIFGEGRQTRSFCYVDDLIDGIVGLMNSDAPFLGPVNLGNPAEITVHELADLILNLTGSHSRIIYQSMPADDPTRRRPDISLANDVLNWSPRIDLKIGLEKTIPYFERQLALGQLLVGG
jgi:UDP-glucuronate decarboxylase